MSLQDIQTKLLADLNSTIVFNNGLEAKVNALLASKTQLTADAEALLQAVQGAGVPIPAAVTAATALFANEQPAIEAYGVKAIAILEAQNKVLSDIAAVLAPATTTVAP